MTEQEALKLALEALEGNCTNPVADPEQASKEDIAIIAIRKALAQPEQEPVACPYCKNWATLGAVYYDQNCVGCVKRMTAPPQRTWVGLTDEEQQELYDAWMQKDDGWGSFYTLIEAKLRSKNT